MAGAGIVEVGLAAVGVAHQPAVVNFRLEMFLAFIKKLLIIIIK